MIFTLKFHIASFILLALVFLIEEAVNPSKSLHGKERIFIPIVAAAIVLTAFEVFVWVIYWGYIS